MSEIHARRRQRAGELISAAGFGAAAFVPGPNFNYLTGLDFHLMERPTILFVTGTGDVLSVMPELERLKWSGTFPGAPTFYWQDSDGFETAFADAAAGLGNIPLCVEGGRMRMFEYDALCRHMGGPEAVNNGDHVLAALRMAKDDEEIAALKQAIKISELALAETLEEVGAGVTERQVQKLLGNRLLELGADAIAFGPIALAGARAANPHGTPGDTELRPGDVLLIDFGGKVGGYNADITRTFFIGHATDEHASIYETVLAANTLGRKECRPGMTAHDLDSAVTGVLRGSPFAGLIVHKTGHGLGLDVHEAPQIMIGNHEPLIPGAVITIEPGLYREGEIGVRIEDDVLMTGSDSISLTGFDRKLRILR